MSHDSGFRRGGHDFSHRTNPRSKSRDRGSRQFEQRMAQRFHEHEREVTAQPPSEKEEPEA